MTHSTQLPVLIIFSTFNLLSPNLVKATEVQAASASNDSQEQRQAQPSSTKANLGEKSKDDLPNFHEVHPYLYRGGAPTEKGLSELKQIGVSTIIDLRAPSECRFNEKEVARKLGLTYLNLVMDSRAPTKRQIDQLLKTIDTARQEAAAGNKDRAVFVHCAHGSDRTGCMIGLWRVTEDGWDYPRAYKEMREYYFGPRYTQLSGTVENYAEKSK